MSLEPIPTIRWQQNDTQHEARWISEAGLPAPERVVVADDTLSADAAFRLCRDGTAILWQGDYQNARNLLQALARRADRPPRRGNGCCTDPEYCASDVPDNAASWPPENVALPLRASRRDRPR